MFFKTLCHLVSTFFIFFISVQGFAQTSIICKLEKMPIDLETDFALSALPAHLRADATVYLLDPKKGYYIVRQGSNSFMCFVVRTEWEWGIFSEDIATPISYDAEGTETIFKVYQDVAAMRASGKFTASQVRDSVISRINKNIYKAPTKTGISYMLAPVMRNYPGNPGDTKIMTMSIPHHMIYAPYVTDIEIGNTQPYKDGPLIINPGSTLLGKGKGPFGYIILPVGSMERAKIIEENGELLKRLSDYKVYFKIESAMEHH